MQTTTTTRTSALKPAQSVALASGFDDAGALPIRADANVLGTTVRGGESLWHELAPNHVAYVVAATPTIRLNGELLDARDCAAIRDEYFLRIDVIKDAELVLVDAASTAPHNSRN